MNKSRRLLAIIARELIEFIFVYGITHIMCQLMNITFYWKLSLISYILTRFVLYVIDKNKKQEQVIK